MVQCTWDEVPHLDAETKKEMLASIPPYQRKARMSGLPVLGSGAIYPVPEEDILVPDMVIPDYWPRGFAMDVGWNRTAGVWGARDNETGTVYLYSEYYRGQAEPSVHAQGFLSRGDWIPGVIDPAARGRGQRDGRRLVDDYKNLGLDLEPAVNAVEAGIYDVWQRLSSGKLKVFNSLVNWLTEFRIYQRNVDGKIIKANDHLMDCTRYLIVSGLERFQAMPVKKEKKYSYAFGGDSSQQWMQ